MYKYTELHTNINHEIRIPQSFNVTVFLKCYNWGYTPAVLHAISIFKTLVVPENRKQFLQSSRKLMKQLHFIYLLYEHPNM